jgi:alpha-beta hydrolase superfamily lysophospholipase
MAIKRRVTRLFSALNANLRYYHPSRSGCGGFEAELPSGPTFIHQWEPQSQVKQGTLLFVHGLNDHGARFEPHVQYYQKIGLGVVALDLAGEFSSTNAGSHHSCTAMEGT